MMKTIISILITLALTASAAHAKLPAQTEEQKTAAAAAKDKAAWTDKVAAYQLCLRQGTVAAAYLKAKNGTKPVIDVPPCIDPGAYVPPVAAVPVLPGTPAPAVAPVAPIAPKAAAAAPVLIKK
jgi:hypothetical protein